MCQVLGSPVDEPSTNLTFVFYIKTYNQWLHYLSNFVIFLIDRLRDFNGQTLSIIILINNKSDSCCGHPILLLTHMITDQIGLHSVP